MLYVKEGIFVRDSEKITEIKAVDLAILSGKNIPIGGKVKSVRGQAE